MLTETFCEAASSILFALLLPFAPNSRCQPTNRDYQHSHAPTDYKTRGGINRHETYAEWVIYGTSFCGISVGKVQLDTRPQLTTKYFGTKQSLSSLLSKTQTMKSKKLLFHTQLPPSKSCLTSKYSILIECLIIRNAYFISTPEPFLWGYSCDTQPTWLELLQILLLLHAHICTETLNRIRLVFSSFYFISLLIRYVYSSYTSYIKSTGQVYMCLF